MKDLYSFHADEKDLINFYQKVKKSYFKIFKRCNLKTRCVEASSGTIGGEMSHEFMVLSDTGEDKVLICKNCPWAANVEKVGKIKKCPKCQGVLEKRNAIEAGHIFNLGTKYSEAMSATFRDKDGKIRPIIMGCYGIGLPRLLATIVEVWHDKNGIIWPKEVSPFSAHLIQIENSPKIKKSAEKLYQDLQKKDFEVLYDDREDKSAGEKFADCDLIGIPYRIVISERTLKRDSVEIKERNKKETKLVKIVRLSQFLNVQ